MRRLYEIRKKVSDYIKLNNMLEEGDTVVAGISGGADSMCLLNILIDIREEYNLKLVAVHIHHGIRGAEADGDMAYVEEFCGGNNIEYRGIRYDIPQIAKTEHLSSEEAGRIKRYEAFEKILEEKTRDTKTKGKIAVAHNTDDNSETFLLNLFRGTGLAGLSGIQPVRGNIIRPVLCLTRAEILEYLKEKNVSYRTDHTNEETEYTRNKIRLQLMPYVTGNINDKAMDNVNRAAAMLSDVNNYMEKQAEKAFVAYTVCEHDDTYILKNELWCEEDIIVKMTIRKVIQKAAGRLKDITAAHVQSIEGLGDNKVSKSVNIPYGIRAIKTYDGVKIEKVRKEHKEQTYDIKINLDDILDNAADENVPLAFFNEKNKSIDLSEKMYTKWMDYDILEGILSIRNRKSGDYIVIGTNGQKKKLKDLLIDMKVPKEDRDKLVLLAKGSEVLWIAGYRMSERCKITEYTKRVIRVEYTGK